MQKLIAFFNWRHRSVAFLAYVSLQQWPSSSAGLVSH